MSGKETVAVPPGTLPRAQEPLRSQSEARNRNDSPACSLKFLPKGPIKNISALVQIMAWLRPGDKPLSEPMMVLLPMHKCVTRPQWVKKNWNLIDSLVPGRCGCNLKIFKLTPRIDIVSTSCKIDFRSMMQYLTDEESALVQIMAWCHQAASHYLRQCWPRSMFPYVITRPQLVHSKCAVNLHSGSNLIAFLKLLFPQFVLKDPKKKASTPMQNPCRNGVPSVYSSETCHMTWMRWVPV